MLKIELHIEDCPYCFNKEEYTSECLSIATNDNQFYIICDCCSTTSPTSHSLIHVTDEWNVVSLATQAAFKVRK